MNYGGKKNHREMKMSLSHEKEQKWAKWDNICKEGSTLTYLFVSTPHYYYYPIKSYFLLFSCFMISFLFCPPPLTHSNTPFKFSFSWWRSNFSNNLWRDTTHKSLSKKKKKKKFVKERKDIKIGFCCCRSP